VAAGHPVLQGFMPDRKEKFWFHAKSYGWGWGLPACWQGWLVLLGYVGLVIAGIGIDTTAVGYIAYLATLTVIFIVFVAMTGEKPAKWRWGRKNE